MGLLLLLLLLGVGAVGVPVSFVFWIRAPRGRLLHRTLIVGGAAAVWLLLVFVVAMAMFQSAVSGIGGGSY